MKPIPMEFDVFEVAPHLHVKVTVRRVWRWRLAVWIVSQAVRVCCWLGADVSANVLRKDGGVK